VVASVLTAAAQAQVKVRLATQLQVALETPVLIEQAKGTLIVRQEIDEATAFHWLRLSARSSSRTVTVVAQEILAGRWPPCRSWPRRWGGWPGRQAEQRAHARAIALHDQAADQYDRLGQDERARPNKTALSHEEAAGSGAG